MTDKLETHLDRTGRPINVGDYIVYGHALGRCAGLQFGKVLAIKFRQARYHDPNVAITVIGVDEDFGHKPKLNRSTGALLFPSRIVVLDRDRLPAEIADMLDGYVLKEKKVKK